MSRDVIIDCTGLDKQAVQEWCQNNIGDTGWDCWVDPNTFKTFCGFTNKDDATRFKLTFGG